jgi:excisionase family DNA binding protein
MTTTSWGLVDRKELAALLKVSPQTVDRMRKDGMPFMRLGKRTVRFQTGLVMAWLVREGRLVPTDREETP